MKRTWLVSMGIVLLALVGGGQVISAATRKKMAPKPAAMRPGKKAPAPVAIGRVLFDFENDLEGWRIPEWATVKKDNALTEVASSGEQASHGARSLRMSTEFDASMWSGAYVEIERQSGEFMNFNGHDAIQVSVYLPFSAPKKLKGEIILTVGEDWSWTEMRQPVELKAGAWTTVTADISDKSVAWKIPMNDAVRGDVRKLGVRVSANYLGYHGPVYIDDLRLTGTSARNGR